LLYNKHKYYDYVTTARDYKLSPKGEVHGIRLGKELMTEEYIDYASQSVTKREDLHIKSNWSSEWNLKNPYHKEDGNMPLNSIGLQVENMPIDLSKHKHFKKYFKESLYLVVKQLKQLKKQIIIQPIPENV
jgi:hypothetical protein